MSRLFLYGSLVVCLAMLGCNRLSGVRIVIRDSGSDTMVNLAQAWAEEYSTVEPTVSVEVGGGGSATGITSLIDGTADLANCSRRMEPEEREAAKRRHGSDRSSGQWATMHWQSMCIRTTP